MFGEGPNLERQFGEALAWEVHTGRISNMLALEDLTPYCKDLETVSRAFMRRSFQIGSTTSGLYQQIRSEKQLHEVAILKKETIAELGYHTERFKNLDQWDCAAENNHLDATHTKMWNKTKIAFLEAQIKGLEGLVDSASISTYWTSVKQSLTETRSEMSALQKEFNTVYFNLDAPVDDALVTKALRLSELCVADEMWQHLEGALDRLMKEV